MSGAVRAHLPLDGDPDVVPPAAVGIHRGADEFWKHTADALKNDGYETEYYTRYDGSTIDAAAAAA